MKINNKKGFTLIELMVVIAIIGVLATAGLGMYSNQQAKSRDSKRLSDIRTLLPGIEAYRSDNSTYPVITTKCISDSAGNVSKLPGDNNNESSLKSYFDNKKLPTDPSKLPAAGCTTATSAGSYFYSSLTKGGPNLGYILGANVEIKTTANFLYAENKIADYEKANTEIERALTAQEKKPGAGTPFNNTIYAIVN